MSMKAFSGHDLGRLLVLGQNAAIPLEEVRDIQLLIPVGGALTLRIDLNVTHEMLGKLILAMQELKDNG